MPSATGEATFIGDMMIQASVSDIETDVSKVPNVDTIIVTSAPETIFGAVVEIFPDFTDEGTLISNFRAAGTLRTVKMAQGSAVIYAVQANDDAVLDGGDIGLLLDIDLSVAGNQISGISGQQIDSNLSTTDQFLVRGFSEKVGNEVGVANAIILVSIASDVGPGAQL